MLDLLYQRLDFIFFVYAALFLLTAKKAFINSRLEKKNDLWFFLSIFLLMCGARYIVDAISLSGYNTGLIFDVLSAAACLALIEYVVSNTRFLCSRRYLRLTTLWLVLLLVLLRIFVGERYTDIITRFLFLIGGLGSSIKIFQMERTDDPEGAFRKDLYMVAVFLGIFCLFQAVELNTDSYIKWLHRSQSGLFIIFVGMLFAIGLLIFTEKYLKRKCSLLGINRRG